MNVDVAVVDVASKLPTVSCVPVAIKAPDELVVSIELAAYVAEPLPQAEPDDQTTPEPFVARQPAVEVERVNTPTFELPTVRFF
jgi:hypothetical protein